MVPLEPGPPAAGPVDASPAKGQTQMSRLMTTLAALGTVLAATGAQAVPNDGRLARSNGPNMPLSRDVVPSEIRPQEPTATGSMKGRASPAGRSRWQDIKRPPARPPSL